MAVAEQELRAILDATMDVIVVFDSDRRFLSVNDADGPLDALERAAEPGQDIDLLISDVIMPACLEKPFDQLSLLRAVRSLLDQPARTARD